jgi:hypothetical protein
MSVMTVTIPNEPRSTRWNGPSSHVAVADSMENDRNVIALPAADYPAASDMVKTKEHPAHGITYYYCMAVRGEAFASSRNSFPEGPAK